MTTILLVRHGDTDAVGRSLAGRATGVPLNAAGREQALALGLALSGASLRAVFCSPLERAVQTATALARPHGLTVEVREALTDVDFGEWTGSTLAQLDADPRWRAFNGDRERAVAPGGESLREVRARTVEALADLARTTGDGVVAVVTHAEVIRCAIAAALGQSLDEILAVAIDTASVSMVETEAAGTRVRAVNLSPAAAAEALARRAA